MKNLYLTCLILLPLGVFAQSAETAAEFCRMGKIRSAERLASNEKARLAYPGDATIDVTYYGLDLRLTTSPANLRGAVTISLKSTVSSLSSFFLDLNSTTTTTGNGLRVDSVKVGTQKVQFQHTLNKLTIVPPQPLSQGQALTLTVFYQGVPNGDANGSFKFDTHDSTTDPVVWSLSEPYGAPDWFPCRDTPADKADSSSVRITAPAALVSVSNGKLISTTTNADGTRTFLWKNSYPIAQYLISIAVSNYAQYDTPFAYNGQTMPVTHYIYPENLAQVQNNLALTPKIIGQFTSQFGAYPFLREKYGHAQFRYGNGGMEHQTATSMELRALTPTIIAHELAHQWFGDKITCRDWQNIWLNEGFASYAEALYTENATGKSAYQTYMNSFLNSAKQAQGSIYVQNISSINSIFDANRSYAKGAAVLHMLRGIVGDSTFFRTLRTYAATPSLVYGTAVTEDFQAVAQQVSGQNLDYFFKEWIYGTGYPTYTVTSTLNGSTATVRVVQPNAAATLFTMPVQLALLSTTGDTTKVTVLNNQADQTFTLTGKGTLASVAFDPNNWILKTATLLTTVTPGSPVLATTGPEDLYLRVYPNPTAETITVDFIQTTTGPVTMNLTNLLGQSVRTQNDNSLPPGKYSRSVGLKGLSGGRYVLTISTPNGQQSRTVVVP